MAEVVVSNIVKSFGKVAVLKEVSVAIADGEMLVVLGPSGCGKSTLLRIIAGLETATAGDVVIGGRRVNDLEPAERDIAMVFQNYALYPHMTVRQNMAYGLKNLGTAKAVIEARVAEAAQILGLAELLDRKPRQLSGGQRQRVAMGRAIVREPEAFLFDEPLSNLDAKLRVQMRHEIKQLQRRLGTTGIFVTHDQVEAMTLGDRLLVLNPGRGRAGRHADRGLRPAGEPLRRRLHRLARDERARRHDRRRRCHRDLRRGAAALEHPLADAAGREVRVGIRPEHLVAEAAGTPSPAAGLDVEVEWVELLGADTVAHGRLADGQAISLRRPGDRPVAAGDRFHLTPTPAHLHLFDPATGRRIG
ncbi:MAG: sn-glycerol-3-phosphate ABC transporter ATP-binding protein UgpC [Geminicoccaceae bacterium]